MTIRAIAGATATFAHLLGRGAAAATRAEDKEEDKKDAKGAGAEDDKDEDTDEERKDAKAGDDGEDDDPEAKAEDTDEDEDKKDKDAKAARKAERARCRAIFASPHAAGRAHVAAQLAFDTDLTAAQAIGVLASVGADDSRARPRGLAAAMATLDHPNPGAGDAAAVDPTDPKAVASLIIAAGKKRRGESA